MIDDARLEKTANNLDENNRIQSRKQWHGGNTDAMCDLCEESPGMLWYYKLDRLSVWHGYQCMQLRLN